MEFRGGKFEDVPGSEREWPADLVFLAMGFLGPEGEIAERLGVALDPRSNYQADYGRYATSVESPLALGRGTTTVCLTSG